MYNEKKMQRQQPQDGIINGFFPPEHLERNGGQKQKPHSHIVTLLHSHSACTSTTEMDREGVGVVGRRDTNVVSSLRNFPGNIYSAFTQVHLYLVS